MCFFLTIVLISCHLWYLNFLNLSVVLDWLTVLLLVTRSHPSAPLFAAIAHPTVPLLTASVYRTVPLTFDRPSPTPCQRSSDRPPSRDRWPSVRHPNRCGRSSDRPTYSLPTAIRRPFNRLPTGRQQLSDRTPNSDYPIVHLLAATRPFSYSWPAAIRLSPYLPPSAIRPPSVLLPWLPNCSSTLGTILLAIGLRHVNIIADIKLIWHKDTII